MRLPRPRSLAGQMALLLGLALLVAQLANFALILNERQKLSLAQNQGPALTRFAGVAADVVQAEPAFRAALLRDDSHRGARFALAAGSGIAEADRDAAIEAQLTAALANQGVKAKAVRAASGGGSPHMPPDAQLLRLAAQTDAGWLTARMVTPRRDPWLAARLGLSTALLYLIVLGATIWIAMRLVRPLRALTSAAERFGGRDAPQPVVPSGPADLRRAVEAFNAMNRRVVALLDEKDHMLGAIGHDLRTPLASLRIRVEAMEPAEDREAAIATIAELTRMLEDILVLARSGRAREEARPIDVAALAEAVAEDHAARGEPVTFRPSPRVVAAVQSGLLRRALANLIDNAVRHAGDAEVSVETEADAVLIRVADHGPGIPADAIERVLEPFQRLETSRNRATGGTGLGLAIARGIAENHGGALTLSANAPHGLIATLRLPL